MRIVFFISQPDKNRPFPGTVTSRDPVRTLYQSGQIRIADCEINIDRVDLVELCQNRVVAICAHKVPRDLQSSVDTPVKRGGNLRITKVEPGKVPLCYRCFQV